MKSEMKVAGTILFQMSDFNGARLRKLNTVTITTEVAPFLYNPIIDLTSN
jgi:hypothetical protein